MKEVMPLSFSAVILNGGSGRRFGGIDKQCIEIQRIPAGRLLASSLCRVSDDVIVAGRPHAIYEGLPLRQIPDGYSGLGPAEGLRSGLDAARHEWVLLCAVDMPFFSPALLMGLIKKACSSDASIIACVLDGQLQPFEALYRKSLLPALAAYLEQNDRHSLRRFMDRQRLLHVEEEEVDRLCPGRFPFMNLNDPGLAASALRALSERGAYFDRLFSDFQL